MNLQETKLTTLLTVLIPVYVANGLFTPAWYFMLLNNNGIEKFGVFLGIIAIGSTISAYFTGYISNNKKPDFIFAFVVLIQAIVMFAYTFISMTSILYFLQLLYGMISLSIITLEQVYIARLSMGSSKAIGAYNTLVHGSLAISLVVGGFLAQKVGAVLVISMASLLSLIGVVEILIISFKDKLLPMDTKKETIENKR